MSRRALLMVLALCPVIAPAEPLWLKATSANFELYTTAGEAKARELIRYFEHVNSFFQAAVHASRSGKGRVRIIAFQSEAEYRPYRLREPALAYSSGDATRDEIVLKSFSAEDYPVAIHEYVHVLLKPVKNVPLWLNEGLAELFSSLRPEGKKVLVGTLLPGRMRVLQSSGWMDLDALCAVDLDSPYYTSDHTQQEIFYAESWALTYMLALSDQYRPKFPEFLQLTTGGERVAVAFGKAFGKQMPDVLADLRQYIRGERFTGLLFEAALAASAEDPEIRPVTPLESGLVLASLLEDIHKTDEARQAYRRLAEENPASPEVPEAQGYLAWRAEQRGEALAQFARAAELGSKNAHMYYDYSALAGDTDAARSKRISLLRTAVALDPRFEDARYHLGLLLVAEGEYEKALAQFAGVTNARPEESFEFFRAVAYAAFQTGDEEKAHSAVRRAAEYAKYPIEKASVAQLASAIGEGPSEQPASPPPASPTPPTEPALDMRSAATPETLQQRLPSTVEGTLEGVECLEHATRLRVIVNGRAMRFLTDRRRPVEIRGRKGRPFALVCGPMKTRSAVLVEYEPAVNEKLGTVGVVGSIELK
jgi:Flp pilus assembly protein TadD